MKKQSNKIRRVGLIANFEKPSSKKVLRRAISLITASGRSVATDEAAAQIAGLKCATFPNVAALAQGVDLLLVFGGDGTMLRAVRETDGHSTPILGINVGRLGFLTAISSNDLPIALSKVWSGDFLIEPRALIQATGPCQEKQIASTALNEIVVSHGAISRVIELDVTVDGIPLTRYRGDGLIVSSPTGSTGYSLSAGGPIISPSADVFAITPICAHALSNRSVIVSLKSVIEVELVSKEMETVAAADGQLLGKMAAGDKITIRRSRRIVNLLQLGDSTFFETIRQKLHWSGSSV